MAALASLSSRASQRRGLNIGRIGGWLLNILLVMLGLFMFAPFYWVLVTSVLPQNQAYALPPVWFPTRITFDSFRKVFELIPFGLLVLNSLKISIIITVG